MDTVLILGIAVAAWYLLNHASAQAQASATTPTPVTPTPNALSTATTTPTAAQTLQQQAIAQQYPGPIPTPVIEAGTITTVVPLTGQPSPPLSSGSLDYYFTDVNPAPAVGAYSTTLNYIFNALQVYGQHQTHSVDDWNTYLNLAYQIPAPDPPILSGSMDLVTYWTTMEPWVASYLGDPNSVNYYHPPVVAQPPTPIVGRGVSGWAT